MQLQLFLDVLEDYQNSIAKNLRVRDVAVDIYGVAMIPPPPRGEIFFHQAGEGIYLFTRQGGEWVSSQWRMQDLMEEGREFSWTRFKLTRRRLLKQVLRVSNNEYLFFYDVVVGFLSASEVI